MTNGYGSADPVPAGPGEGAFPSEATRPGPLPPRIEPTRAAAPAYPPHGHPAPAAPPARATWSPSPQQQGAWNGSQAAPTPVGWGSAPAPPHPGVPTSAPAYPGAPAPARSQQGTQAPAASGVATGWAGAPGPTPSYPGQPSVPGSGGPGGPGHGPGVVQPAAGGWPGSGPPPTAAGGRGRWVAVGALVLAGLLTVVTGVQAYQINRLSDRLGETDGRLAAAQAGDGNRLDGLENRAEALEKQAGAAFNPEAVASAALPSVFRVRAGQFTGTAFAIGKPVAGGGTNLFTNFHVVEGVWEGGGREVFLERTDQRFSATIIKVDKANDIAHLRSTGKFTGLVAAATPVKSGQQIVVVGAPLGLEDSVTTGVVSAFRKAGGGDPPVIQFDAPINPGNSGGPVINGGKQVVGIATAKARDAEGIGLAVPIKVACDGFRIC